MPAKKKKKKAVKKPVKKPAYRAKKKTEPTLEEKVDAIGNMCHQTMHLVELLTKLGALMAARAGMNIEVITSKEDFVKELEKMRATLEKSSNPDLN